MTIEVRQLQVNSNVLPERAAPAAASQACSHKAEIREEVLEECRRLILEILQAERER